MAKLSFGKKKMTGMVPPVGPGPGMGRGIGGMMGGPPIASKPKFPPPGPAIPMPKPKGKPVMKQKGMALSGFAPGPKKAIPKKKATPRMAGNPFKKPF